MIAGGVDDPLAALRAIRALSAATIVMKRGPMGCVVFPGAIPDFDRGRRQGAGLSGRGLQRARRGRRLHVRLPARLAARRAARDLLRLRQRRRRLRGVAPALLGGISDLRRSCSHFLEHGSPHRALRHDDALNHIHWATTRRAQPPTTDGARHRPSRADWRRSPTRPARRASGSASFKRLAVEAAARVAAGRPGFGMLLDGNYGREALFRAADHGFWIGRPVEEPGSRPLDFEFGGSLGAKLVEWPVGHTIKCLCFYHPDDRRGIEGAAGARTARASYDAARTIGRELLIEIIAGKHGPSMTTRSPRVIDAALRDRHQARLVEARGAGDWRRVGADRRGDRGWRSAVPRHRGARPRGAGGRSGRRLSDRARVRPFVKGFAVGRTIFVEPALGLVRGRRSTTPRPCAGMADSFARLCALWRDAGGAAPSPALGGRGLG